jgi:hypothetical protein
VIGVHEADDDFDEVVDVAKRASLRAVSVDGDGMAKEGLDDEVRDNPPVIRMHTGAIGVENATDSYLDAMGSVVVEKKGLSAPLSLIIAGTEADRIDVTPVGFGLRMKMGIAIYLACGGLKNFAPEPFGKS